MSNKFKTIIASLVLVFMAQSASAAVIDFDDLGDESFAQISDGYAGFNWNVIGALAGDDYPGTGLDAAVVSGSNLAFNAYGAWSSIDLAGAGSFDFIGAWFGSYFFEQELAFEGWLDGVLVYATQVSFVITPNGPNWIQLDWAGIDQLLIYNSLADWGVSWGMDDFTVEIHRPASVPEASGLVLLLMGALGVGMLRRRA
uniref:hypothetical protein n=1 Tax=Cellvibrio fontiphilus TaxID=1815559 RepID=UPI002B4C0A80|nr:hypothetical protein [Cellvibrio fontiphilus]